VVAPSDPNTPALHHSGTAHLCMFIFQGRIRLAVTMTLRCLTLIIQQEYSGTLPGVLLWERSGGLRCQ